MSNQTHDTNDAGGGAVDLDAIEARAKAICKGPWEVDEWEQSRLFVTLPEADGGQIEIHPLGYREDAGEREAEAIAAFIAHARADIPALVSEARRLRAFLASLKAKAQQSIMITPRHFEAFEKGTT